jgi:hypothetical protein
MPVPNRVYRYKGVYIKESAILLPMTGADTEGHGLIAIWSAVGDAGVYSFVLVSPRLGCPQAKTTQRLLNSNECKSCHGTNRITDVMIMSKDEKKTDRGKGAIEKTI